LARKIEAAGFKFLGFWDQGFKNISNNKREVRTPADLKGVKIRTQENPLLVDIYKALGADATPMPFPEVYTSIQQGVVDGYEGSIVPFSDIKLYEIQDYLTEARINYAAAVHIMNKDKFESLDPELQQIIVDAAQKFEQEERKYNLEKTNELMELTKNEGVQVIGFDEIDLPAFREAVQPIYEHYNEFDDLMQKIKALEK
jgi:TRAP-type C4-dicarboxylate transport system substrate-binding protein